MLARNGPRSIGLPRPKAQVPIHDSRGRFVGRPDLYYERIRLGIEYDGMGHRERMAEDNVRQNRLLNAGVRLLRFTASDVLNRPDLVVADVRTQLTAGGISGGTRRKLNHASDTKRVKYQRDQ